MAGAGYTHTIDFQLKGKAVEDVVQLGGAPGEREMCAAGTTSRRPAVGRQDRRRHRPRVRDRPADPVPGRPVPPHNEELLAGRRRDGATFIAALEHGKIACGMTTQPTVAAIEKLGVGYSAFDLATTGACRSGWRLRADRGRARAHQLGYANKATVQKVVDALVATMHWINTHSAAQIADAMPRASLELPGHQVGVHQRAGAGQGPVPPRRDDAGGRPAGRAGDRQARGCRDRAGQPRVTYTNAFASAANKLEGFSG